MEHERTANGQRPPLPRIARGEIREPGTYVHLATGTLHRLPARALAGGPLPPGWQETAAEGLFVRLSPNPYLISIEARIICATHDIRFNF